MHKATTEPTFVGGKSERAVEVSQNAGERAVDQEHAAGVQRRCGAFLNYLVSVSRIRRSIRRTAVVHGLDAAAIIPVCSI